MKPFYFALVKLLVGCKVGFYCLSSTGQSIEPEHASLSKWPSFLNGAVSREFSEELPLVWAPGEEAWRLDLTGTGQSSPVAWIDSIYVTTIDGPNKDQCIVTSIDAHSGKKKWEWSIASTAPFENSHYVSRAAPTPACDAQGVYAFFESGDVVAITPEGKQTWKRSLSQEYGKFQNEFGLGSSVAQSDTAIFILIDHSAESYIVALDKSDGKTLWKVDRGVRGQSYASPVCWRIGAKEQVVVSSAGSVDGYDALTGAAAWSFKDVGGNTGATPILQDDGRFLLSSRTGAGSGGRPRAGANSAAEKTEPTARPIGDGPAAAPPSVIPESGNASKTNLLARMVESSGEMPLQVEWISPKAKGSLCSPLLHQGFAYFQSSAGVVYCVDAASGELCYEKRIPSGACWASPIAVGNRVYFFGNRGSTTVLEVGRDYKELVATNRLWTPSENESPMAGRDGPTHYATIAWNDSLIMRTGETVYCFQRKKD